MDETAGTRQAMVPLMPLELQARVANGEQVWDTAQMQEEFQAIGFSAPFVAVKRRSDGVKGTLMFTHSPRYYFGWEEAS